ncbi:expressed unknown protein [Seminavis robusta]|uniref:Uncharacterized protein n=1 Tax=Seminavis robusta TaxID=568900 RepID=A0A9N8HN92_9STRA|nr:expressed unknown protein [Seminavis robusta]|eukprot:Sro1189_g250730.1 n/a (239) ;mRNA; f:32842-33558
MALSLIDAMATTPTFATSKSVLGEEAPLPPAPPRIPRNVIPTAEHDSCVKNVHHASLTALPSATKTKPCPILTLGVQHRRHSAPAMLAFQTAFAKMKEKGMSDSGRSLTSGTANTTAKKEPSAAMSKLNSLFPTSPGSLQKAARRRRQKDTTAGLGQSKNATFKGVGKSANLDAQQILAGLMKGAASSSAAGTSTFTKTSSSGKLLLGHAAGMPRTSSGARLVNNNMRKVRSSGSILF